ncbi:MAG: hypothetical protein KJ000_35960, partial [Pirellulaceae bacterium]|nr:hypothetical protein [Pirellulaceae bacterium]
LVEMVLPDPDGLGSPQWTYTYDAAGQRLTETDPLGRTSSYQYDALGRVVEYTLPDPDGAGPLAAPVYAYAYDLAGNLLSVTDPLNNTTSYAYDDFDRVVTVTDALSGATGFAYDAAGQLLERTDPLDRTTAWAYDQLGRTVAVTDPLNQTTAFAYDAVGNLLSVTDPLSNTTSYAYDNLYRRTAVTDPLSGVTAFTFDAAGQLLEHTDPLSRTSAWDYDGLGRVTSVTDPLNQTTSYLYDAAGNLLSVTDPLNRTTSYQYDDLYRRTAIIDPLAGMTTFSFDLAGNLTGLTDPVDNTTAWDYDGLNRVVAETNELNDARTFTYDAANNLLTRTDRNGRVIEYAYDALHRRVEEQWLDDQQTVIRTLSFSYDAASQLTAAADPAASYDYQYDALGRRTSVTHDIAGLGFPVVLASAYDAAGNRTSLSATIDTTADFVNQYTYDALHRMTRIEQAGVTGGNAVAEKRIDLSYDAASQYQTITRYADLAATKLVATSDYAFDAAGRLTGLSHAQGTTPLAGYTWTYDAGNRITEFTSLLDGTADYTYDDTDQLTGADYTYQDDEAFAYDANGNRTMTGYATGDNNLVLSDGTYDYEYDAEGNRTRRTHIASGEVTEYQWDHRNRLTRVSIRTTDNGPLTTDILYAYDAFNRLVRVTLHTTDNGPLTTDTFHVYDGERWERGNAGDHLALVFDGNGDLTNRYLYGPAVDQILADEQLDSLTTPGDVLWPLTDNLGTVRDLAAFDDATGDTTVVNHRTYTAFGQILSETDPTIEHRFAYTARHWDDDAQLYHYRARWYEPALGRFLSEDPIGFEARDANLQRYVGNASTNATDPSGLHPIVFGRIMAEWHGAIRDMDARLRLLAQAKMASLIKYHAPAIYGETTGINCALGKLDAALRKIPRLRELHRAGESQGAYRPGLLSIGLGKERGQPFMSTRTLVHELVHALDHQEGLTSGCFGWEKSKEEGLAYGFEFLLAEARMLRSVEVAIACREPISEVARLWKASWQSINGLIGLPVVQYKPGLITDPVTRPLTEEDLEMVADHLGVQFVASELADAYFEAMLTAGYTDRAAIRAALEIPDDLHSIFQERR